MGRRGFTLIELMIAVAIIGVLALVATVAYRAWIRHAYISEAQDMISQIPHGRRAVPVRVRGLPQRVHGPRSGPRLPGDNSGGVQDGMGRVVHRMRRNDGRRQPLACAQCPPHERTRLRILARRESSEQHGFTDQSHERTRRIQRHSADGPVVHHRSGRAALRELRIDQRLCHIGLEFPGGKRGLIPMRGLPAATC